MRRRRNPQINRVKPLHQADFDRVFAQNRNIKGKLVSVWIACPQYDKNAPEQMPDTAPPERRLGMKVTKKTFRLATERNRAKRLLRESFRLLLPQLRVSQWDLVAIPRRKILEAKEPDVRKELSRACEKSGLAAGRSPIRER